VTIVLLETISLALAQMVSNKNRPTPLNLSFSMNVC
jgi:hypothetical protein